MAVDLATEIVPKGLGLVILAVTLFFVPLCVLVVILRCVVRAKHGVFGVDDGLMLVGWMLFMVVVGVVSRGTYVGIGARDDRLNEHLKEEGKKYVWLFQISYCCSLVFIKSSICVTLLRIAVTKTHRLITWVTLAASCLSTVIIIIGLLSICRPISANWNKAAGSCASPAVITSLSYLVSATAVATDWICAILPGFMLYKAQMKKATKISISIILGLGVLASIATIVRLPYLQYYGQPEDYLYNIGSIILWSVFESGIGIIAGSLPSLRRLLKNWVNFDSSNGHSSTHVTPYTGTAKATVTSKARAVPSARRTKGITSDLEGNREWEQLDDASSSRKIYVKVDMEMQSLERHPTESRSRDSLDDVRVPT